MAISTMVRKAIAFLPAPMARRALYFHRFGKLPNFEDPSTFQEKLNLRILRDRRPLLVTASSKVISKEYVSSKRVPGLRVPITYWHGQDLSEINGRAFESNWILKPSHRSGGVHLSSDSVFRQEEVKGDPRKLLEEREYRRSKLWAYKMVPRELLIEERLGSLDSSPRDYKFFVFDGVVKMIQVDTGRFGHHDRVLYSPSWKPRPEVFAVERGSPEPPPVGLDRMLKVAEELGSEFDFVRVDLYLIEGEVYFGELTVYPGGGLSPWPEELDLELGNAWVLPKAVAERPLGSIRRFARKR